MRQRSVIAFIFGLLILPILYIGTDFVMASSDIKRLQTQITDGNSRLGEIQKEILKYETALREVGAEKNTLQRAINELELERKKVSADIKYTENKIDNTDLEINKLTLEINNAKNDILQNEEAVAEIIRNLNETDEETIIELLLGTENLSEFWNEIEDLQTVRNSIQTQVSTLTSLKQLLEKKHISETDRRIELQNLKSQYTDQNQVLTNNKKEKDTLLVTTRNEEQTYQNLLAEKKAAEQLIQSEIRAYESKLQFILDPSTIPVPGTVVFNWLFPNPIITQAFGGTEFAKRNAALYGGRPYHPGLDIAAPRGTPIKAPLGGTVRAIGNTDLVPGCLSWGKWALIDHANGLSTLYAHQSLVSVIPGQEVQTGEVIGYVGNTGFSTGPHTHFTVYVQEAVKIRKYNEVKTVTSCGAASSPFAPTDAYLDPASYLPK